MIICSCNVLSDKQLREAAEEMRADPNGKVPTPGAVCFPSVIDIIHEKSSEEQPKSEETPAELKQASNR